MASRKRDRAVDRWSSLAPAAQSAAAGFQRLAKSKNIRARGEEAKSAGRKRPGTWTRFLALLDRKSTTELSRRGVPREAYETPIATSPLPPVLNALGAQTHNFSKQAVP